MCLAAGGRAVLRPRRLHRRCSAPLPPSRAPGSRTGLDLGLLVAGPGFEPGKTVVGDFTDRGRYCPDLREYPPGTRFRHALDMVAPYGPHSLAVWQLVHRSCRGPGGARTRTPRGARDAHTRGGPIGDPQCPCSRPQLPVTDTSHAPSRSGRQSALVRPKRTLFGIWKFCAVVDMALARHDKRVKMISLSCALRPALAARITALCRWAGVGLGRWQSPMPRTPCPSW
jgi:hypothetical protein